MFIRQIVSGMACCGAASLALAGYGTYPISHGGEGHAMGSADIARSHSGIGSNVNPAGMTGVERGNFSAYGELFYMYGFEHSDSLGNEASLDPEITSVAGAGYALRPDASSPFVFGVAFVAQGGVGFRYDSLKTQYGESGELEALFGVFRLAPAVAWQATDALSLGVSLGLNYTEGSQSVFKDISVAPQGDDPGFAGLRVDSLSGWDISYRLGLQYRVSDALTLAAIYASPTELVLEEGGARLNYEAFGLGEVHYGNAKVSGLELAEELGVGFSWRVSPEWELAAELNWLNWSAALESSRLTLTRPDNANAPAKIVATTPLEMRDQYVIGIGVLHHWRQQVDLMAGFTYGRNPLPSRNGSPIFNILPEYHFTAGLAWNIDRYWRGIATFFYTPTVTVQYENNSLPLGERGRERSEAVDFTLTFERRW